MTRFYHFWEGLILFGLGGMVANFYAQDQLGFFIAAIYNELVLGAGLFFIVLGAWHFTQMGNEKLHTAPFLRLFLCTLPLIFAFTITPQPLSSETAKARGLSSELTQVQGVMPSFGLKPEDRTLLDWVQLLNFDPEPSHYENQKVHVDGFVSFSEDLSKNTFLITRFTLSCCAADARPIHLQVHVGEGLEFPQENEWIDLIGTMTVREVEDQRDNIVELKEWTSIPVPINPYAY